MAKQYSMSAAQITTMRSAQLNPRAPGFRPPEGTNQKATRSQASKTDHLHKASLPYEAEPSRMEDAALWLNELYGGGTDMAEFLAGLSKKFRDLRLQHPQKPNKEEIVTERDVTEEDAKKRRVTEEDATEEDNTEEDVTEEDVTEEDVTEEDVKEEDAIERDVTMGAACISCTPPVSPASLAGPEAQKTQWQPLPVREFPPLSPEERVDIPDDGSAQKFTLEFLTGTLGSTNWSPGFYWPKDGTEQLMTVRGFYVVDREFDPFVPAEPGDHGAKLVVFYNQGGADDDGPDDEAFHNAPLFVAQVSPSDNVKLFTYHGNYSQTRFSDKLDYDHMVEHVPPEVKIYWARQLASSQRPDWVTKALAKHFYPQPSYQGTFEPPKNAREVPRDFKEYFDDLREWSVASMKEAAALTEEDVMKAFDAAEDAFPPGLRLQWEYLQCVSYDREFYDALAKQARNRIYLDTQKRSGSARKPLPVKGQHQPLLPAKPRQSANLPSRRCDSSTQALVSSAPPGWNIAGLTASDYGHALATDPGDPRRAGAKIMPETPSGPRSGGGVSVRPEDMSAESPAGAKDKVPAPRGKRDYVPPHKRRDSKA